MKNTKTLKELYELQSEGKLDYGIEYSDGSEEGDLFELHIQLKIIANSNNNIFRNTPIYLILEQRKELAKLIRSRQKDLLSTKEWKEAFDHCNRVISDFFNLTNY